MLEYIQIPHPKMGLGQIQEAARIVDNALGSGYFQEHLSEIECAWACIDNGAVVAWAAVTTERHPTAPDVGLLKCVVVDPLYRGRGIAKKLTGLRLDYLTSEEKSCFVIFSYAWVRPDGYCPSCGILESLGFKHLDDIEGYYADGKYKCPVCKGKCKCVASRYAKTNQR